MNQRASAAQRVGGSLVEIFQWIELGDRTGRLAFWHRRGCHYFWFCGGRIVAAADSLDGLGLVRLIQAKGWLSPSCLERIGEAYANNQPLGKYRTTGTALGICLQAQGFLSRDRVKQLFAKQVLQQVCQAFQLTDGQVRFDDRILPPQAEATGLSVPASQAILQGLRLLRDWSALAAQLPESDVVLRARATGAACEKLSRLEWEVLRQADGQRSLADIAKITAIATPQVRQIAFRLLAVNAVDTVEPATVNSAMGLPLAAIAPYPTPHPPRPHPLRSLLHFLQQPIAFPCRPMAAAVPVSR